MGTQRVIFFVVLFSLPLCIAAYFTSVPVNLRETFFSVSKPVFSAGHEVSESLAGTVSNVKDFFFLYQENDQLKKQVEIFEKQVITLSEIEKENGRLRSLLEFKKKTPSRTVASQIIARDVTHLSNWALIDKGSRHGIKKDMPVVNEQGLVGKVVETGLETSRVILLTDIESKVSGLNQNTRDTGLIVGDGSPFLKMKFIDLDSGAKVGDEILSSGMGDVYPKGLPVGKIEFLGREKNGLHLYARVKPAVSFSKIEEVLCLDYQPAN